MRIHRGVVDANFVMQMRPGAAAGKSDIADDLAALHALAVGHRKSRQMPVACGQAVAVINLDHAAVAVVEVREGDHAVGRRHYLLAIMRRDIHAGVECAFTVERINALAERSRNRADDRPERGRRRRPHPVGQRGLLRQAQTHSRPW